MKKALILLIYEDYMALEEARVLYDEGYDIYIVGCDYSFGICEINPHACKTFCRLCHYTMIKKVNELLRMDKKRFHYVSLKRIISDDIRKNSLNISFDYNNVQELKDLKYKGVDIGYGAFSSYVSYTRNVMPDFNKYLKNYIDYSMRAELRMTDSLTDYIKTLHPDKVVFFSGRYVNVKPLLNIAMNNKIDYIATERVVGEKPNGSKYHQILKIAFYNMLPHSINAKYLLINKIWAEEDEKLKYAEGKRFFENKRHSKPAGDVIYTKNQNEGELPFGFDVKKRNISIFNSSEDEFYAISKEFDEASLYPNQYIALKTLFEHYKDNSNMHFYLRIHPNLASVPYKSHTMLYSLKYENVTILPPNSTVSSYALMDKSEKVIVFNSTMGVESSYWGKVVIALSKCVYTPFDIVYTPENERELFALIDDKNLRTKEHPIENWLKLGYAFLGYGGKKYKYYNPFFRHITDPIFSKKMGVNSLFTLLGSDVLLAYVSGGIKYMSYFGLIGKFSRKYIDKANK